MGDAGQDFFEKVQFTENEVIFDEGQPGDGAYMITSGTVAIRKGVRGSNPHTLADLGKGEIIGEMALADGSPRMAAAVATSEVMAIKISCEAFNQRLETMDPTMQAIMRLMMKRVRNMVNEFMGRAAGGH